MDLNKVSQDCEMKKSDITSSTVKLQEHTTKTCFSFRIRMDNAIYALVSAK